MTPAEVRSVVADLEALEAPIPVVDLVGRMLAPDGSVAAFSAGVHRSGRTPTGAEARWFETVTEWHERMP